MTDMSHLLTMHRLFRRLQQKNRFIGRGVRTGLTIAETHFILELQADGSRTIVELAELLGLNQSSGSRISQSLTRQGLIKVSVSKTDSRRRVLSLTAAGEDAIRNIDQSAEQIIAGFAARITTTEMSMLVKMMRTIADGYAHPPGVRRRGESLYRVEQRRITRCFGLLGEHVFGSSLNSSQWQALSEISLSPVAPQATELSTVLGIAQNSLSSVIESLEERAMVKRRPDPDDKRVSILSPTIAGIRISQQIERHATTELRRSLRGISSGELEQLTGILSRFVGELDPMLPPLLPDCELVQFASEEDRRQARGFVARSLVNAGQEAELPERFLGEENSL